MSNAEHKSTDRPAEGAELRAQGYILGVQFHQPLKLDRQQGLEFGARLSGHVESRNVDLQDSSWTFSQPLGDSAAGLLQITVQEQSVTLQAQYPTHRLEWFEDRFGFILDEFQKTFKPNFVLSSLAKVIATVQIDGDARNFLFKHVANMQPERFNPLGRPLHIFGFRLVLPPFQLKVPPKGKGKRGKLIPTEWQADIKVESLGTDIHQLFLDATGQWPPAPREWDNAATRGCTQKLAIVKEYLEKHVIPFLDPTRGNGGQK
jgi:hypothetical protein